MMRWENEVSSCYLLLNFFYKLKITIDVNALYLVYTFYFFFGFFLSLKKEVQSRGTITKQLLNKVIYVNWNMKIELSKFQQTKIKDMLPSLPYKLNLWYSRYILSEELAWGWLENEN